MSKLTPVFLLLMLTIPSCTEPFIDDPPVAFSEARDAVLFAYFTGGGEDGMKYAISADGRDFRRVNAGQVWLKSPLVNGIVRDPSIVRGPDGTWHCVWTSGWWDKGFGIAHSSDLMTWSNPEHVPVMKDIAGTVNVWAPEIMWDPERSEFLVMWASTVRGLFPHTEASSEPGPDKIGLNHRTWYATTKDFKSWSKAKVFFDPGFNSIDATVARDDVRGRWVLILKDETLKPTPQKNLRVAFASQLQGEYLLAPRPIYEAGSWVEGPSILEEAGTWTVYFDRYRDGKFGAVETTDWETFRPVEGLRMPRGVRHGCVLEVPAGTARQLAGPQE